MIKYLLILFLLFFSITVGSASAVEQITITIAPANPWVNDTITITVASNGTPIQSAKVNFDENFVGITGNNGSLDYKLSTSGGFGT